MPSPAQQRAFFEQFGFLTLRGALAQDIAWITEEFEQAWAHGTRSGFTEQGEANTAALVPFIDSRERLCTLVDHPHLEGILENLLGSGYNYLSSDGRPYSGDTSWHPDGGWDRRSLYLKVAIYLDPLTRETGALRVIPGSHLLPDSFALGARDAGQSDQHFGLPQSQIPSVALDSQPGDVVIFNHNTMHAAFGGGNRRRMFTMNLGRRAETPEQIADLEQYIAIHIPTWSGRVHGPTMLATATANRMRHLEQVIAHEGHLPALRAQVVEKARAARAARAAGLELAHAK